MTSTELAPSGTTVSLDPGTYAPPSSVAEPTWSRGTLIAFRVCFVYFGLYVLTTQMLSSLIMIPKWSVPELQGLPGIRDAIIWVGKHVLGIARPIPFASTGSGDKTFDFVHAFTLIAFAAIVAAVWTLRDRRGARDVRMYAWFRVFMRLSLATSMLTYGCFKLIPLQMPAQLLRLVEPFGNFSPMGVLWASIGASYPYEIFVGAAETLAGVLLFFPRTATLGALVCLADVVEVFTLNMTYDVPVKLFSFHLVLMSIFLLAPNIRRLLDLFVMGRATGIGAEPVIGSSPRARRNLVIAQVVLGLYTLSLNLYNDANAWKQSGGGAPKSPLYGVWNVDQMVVDGVEVAPLVTDSTRWRYVLIDRPSGPVYFTRMSGSIRGFGSSLDTAKKSLMLNVFGPKPSTDTLSYARPVHDTLYIDGTMLSRKVHFQLSWRDPDKFPLRSRGFRLVSEFPFNR